MTSRLIGASRNGGDALLSPLVTGMLVASKGEAMTDYPVFRQTAVQAADGAFLGFSARLRDGEQPATGLPTMLHGASVSIGGEDQGEAVTAGFSVNLPDGTAVSCWISARVIDGALQVRSWVEGVLNGEMKVDHVKENPNPRWFQR